MRLNYKYIVTLIALGLTLPSMSRAAGTGSSPVTTNLVLWLESNVGLASDGSSWADQSGLGNNATALPGQNPTVVPGGFNGQTAVEFNESAMSFAAPVVTTQTFTIVALVTDNTTKKSSYTGFREIFSNWDESNSTTSVFLGTTYVAPIKIRFTDAIGGADQGDDGVGKVGKAALGFMLTGVSSATDAQVYLGTKLEYDLESALPPRDFSTGYYLGEQGDFSGEYWNGDIEEILVYSVGLTTQEIKQDWAYLKAKYGL
jgi:hypothetical protein